MNAVVLRIGKQVEIDRKENLRDHRLYWIGRRTQDVILSSVALVVLSPVMLATAIAIVADDPSAGPVFSQERIGRNGKPFKFYKFRSMCPNAEAKLDDLLDQNEMDGPVFKIKDDPRITRVGKFIRKTSLDELPQLWNILKGDSGIIRGCHNRDKGTAENKRLRDPKFIFSYPKNERLIFLGGSNAIQKEISTMRVG